MSVLTAVCSLDTWRLGFEFEVATVLSLGTCHGEIRGNWRKSYCLPLRNYQIFRFVNGFPRICAFRARRF